MSYPDYLLEEEPKETPMEQRLLRELEAKTEQLLDANVEIAQLKAALKAEKAGNTDYYKKLADSRQEELNKLYDEIYQRTQENNALKAKIKVALEDLR